MELLGAPARPTIRTLCDIVTNLERDFAKPAQLLHKTGDGWRPIATAEFAAMVRALALGLDAAGVRKGDRVALLSENRPEWTACDHAIMNLGAVTVPIYATLLAEQIRPILDNSQARALIVSTPAQLDKIRPLLAGRADLAPVVLIDAPPGAASHGATPSGAAASGGAPAARSFADVRRDGDEIARRNPGRFAALQRQVSPDDLASILYTSGTTGDPKGVMLTHGNFASNVNATLAIIQFSPEDVCLSFLPLTHVFERMVEFAYLAGGAAIAYSASFDSVPQDLLEVRPTVTSGVPRFFEKVHARVLQAIAAAPWPRRLMFGTAMKIGRRRARIWLDGRQPSFWVRLLAPLADRLVFAKLRGRIGGRVRFFISGGAPLNPEIALFFHAAGIRILEGYGLTETSPVIAVNTLERSRIGTVGPIVPGVEVRIAPDGEILVRGPNVMKGYYRNEAATREVMEDGWFHTGDIGLVDRGGFLKITDRKKEVLKTSGGKMVAPQPIENLLTTDRFIAQAVLIGDRRKFISALIVPDPTWLESYARLKGIAHADRRELLIDPRILDLYRRRIAAKMAGLPSYETVKQFRLLPRELSQEHGELTPTLKVKRRVIAERYADLIESIYAEAEPSSRAS